MFKTRDRKLIERTRAGLRSLDYNLRWWTVDDRVRKLDQRLVADKSLVPATFDQLRSLQRELGLLQGERTTCPFLRPHIVSRGQYEAIKKAAETISVAMEKVTREALREQTLMNVLGLTPAEEELARVDPGYNWLCTTSRLDAYLTENGFQFLEYNAETPAGVGDQMQLEQVLFSLPQLKSFLNDNSHWLPRPHEALLDSLMESYRAWGGEEEHPQIAIVDWEGVPTGSEFRVLRDYFARSGYPTLIADPHDLEFNGEHLSVNGFRVDILYKRVIIHELLSKFGLEHPLISAYKKGRICMANSFRCKVIHKKSSFAILRDPAYQHLFSDSEVDVIRKHIPWTQSLGAIRTDYQGREYDLLSLIKNEQDQFVLKPNDDYGGHGVFLGWEMNRAQWEEAILSVNQRPYVVQERAKVEKTTMPAFTDHVSLEQLFVDFNPFLFRNKVEGALIRLSPSSLLNVTSGGGETGLLVLEDGPDKKM